MLDFVTHGLCPIVHAADGISVMENLRAVPRITRSARAIIGGRGYRLGPSTIEMRQNPYGSRTIPNPEGGRICMTDDDPRHRAAFGAAWVLGLTTVIAPARMTVWTPASLYGPRGLFAAGGPPWPVAEVIAAMASLAGEPVGAAELTDDTATLRCGGTEFTANLTSEPLRLPRGTVIAAVHTTTTIAAAAMPATTASTACAAAAAGTPATTTHTASTTRAHAHMPHGGGHTGADLQLTL